MRRSLQVVTTGAWLDDQLADGAFRDDGRAWADRVAVAHGLPAGELLVVDTADVDPRPPREPEQPDITPLHAFVLANPDPATWTNAELRTALIRLIRIELRRRGLTVE